MNGAKPDKLKPAVIAGVACGVASSIPLLNCINLCCCALVIGGGFLAAFLYMKEAPSTSEPPYGDGAVLGLLTGVAGAIVATIVSIPMNMIAGSLGLSDPEQLQEMLEQFELPPEALNMLETFMAGGGVNAAAILVGLVLNLVIYSIFALLGGIIGVAVLHKKQTGAPQQPGYAPPPPPAA